MHAVTNPWIRITGPDTANGRWYLLDLNLFQGSENPLTLFGIIAFYRDLLGFEVLVNGAWPRGIEDVDTLTGLKDSAAKMAMLEKGNAMLELFEFESPAPAPGDPRRPVNDHGLTHVCLDVTDLGSEYARLKDAGMFFHSAPVGTRDSCCVYGRDPDGTVLELVEPGPGPSRS